MLDSAKEGAGLASIDVDMPIGAAETVKPAEVDAFWLQRVLNKHYNDADISQVRELCHLTSKSSLNGTLHFLTC